MVLAKIGQFLMIFNPYDKVDKLIGVFGTKENMYNEPDGFFLPPPKPRLHELYIKGARKVMLK